MQFLNECQLKHEIHKQKIQQYTNTTFYDFKTFKDVLKLAFKCKNKKTIDTILKKWTKQVNDEIMETKEMDSKEEYQYLKDNLLVGEKREKKIEKIDRKDELALFEIPGGLEIASMLLRAENEMNRLILDPAWSRNTNKIRSNKVIKVLADALDHTTKKLSKHTGLFSRTIGATMETIGQKTGNLFRGRDRKETSYKEDGVVTQHDNILQKGGRKKTQRRRLKKQKGAKKTQKRKLKIH